jgi:hypothetical protein
VNAATPEFESRPCTAESYVHNCSAVCERCRFSGLGSRVPGFRFRVPGLVQGHHHHRRVQLLLVPILLQGLVDLLPPLVVPPVLAIPDHLVHYGDVPSLLSPSPLHHR